MYELTQIELQRLGTLFVNFFKQKIQEKIYPYGFPQRGVGDKKATGQLLNSLTATVVPKSGGGFELVITYMDYFKYVNLGRRPGVGLVPIPALLSWIKVRGIKGRKANGRFMSNLSLAFAIQKNINKFGIRPANIYDKAYDSFEALLENPPQEFRDEYNSLYAAIGRDVENFIEQTVDKELMSIREL
jgi:hypothetical protein